MAILLDGLGPAPDLEIIVVDGGSTDGTRRVAARFPHVRTLTVPPGRGLQMNAGALASRGEILVFLHADTFFGAAHLETLRQLVRDPGFVAGAYKFRLMPQLPAFRVISWAVNRRCRFFGLPYGDQALIVRRDLFFRVGGYAHRRPEDLDLVLRLKKHTRWRLLEPPVPTSGRRWLAEGYFRTTWRNWLFLARHLAERTFTRRWPQLGEIATLRPTGNKKFQTG